MYVEGGVKRYISTKNNQYRIVWMAHHINLKLYKRKLTKNIVLRIAFLCFSIFGTTGFDYIELNIWFSLD